MAACYTVCDKLGSLMCAVVPSVISLGAVSVTYAIQGLDLMNAYSGLLTIVWLTVLTVVISVIVREIRKWQKEDKVKHPNYIDDVTPPPEAVGFSPAEHTATRSRYVAELKSLQTDPSLVTPHFESLRIDCAPSVRDANNAKALAMANALCACCPALVGDLVPKGDDSPQQLYKTVYNSFPRELCFSQELLGGFNTTLPTSSKILKNTFTAALTLARLRIDAKASMARARLAKASKSAKDAQAALEAAQRECEE